MVAQYQRTGRPLTVNFRELASWLPHPDRASHTLHHYPAKLLAHIPHFFMSNAVLSSPGDMVLDPFCGSGTVLVEALLLGRNAIGADVNPLARLISGVKIKALDDANLEFAASQLISRIPGTATLDPPDVVNLHYWFYPHVIRQLLRIWEAVQRTRDRDLRRFFMVCFSECVWRTSLADPRLTVPVRLRVNRYPEGHPLRNRTNSRFRQRKRLDVIGEFQAILQANCARMAEFSSQVVAGSVGEVIGIDARSLRYECRDMRPDAMLANGSVQLAITSPPYAGAQKYIRASSLSLGWLGLSRASELRGLEEISIGREHYRKVTYQTELQTGNKAADACLKKIRRVNPLRGHIAACYLVEMKAAMGEISRVLKPGGYLVLVSAPNTVAGQAFNTPRYLQQVAETLGFTTRLKLTDHIRSRGLMTRRNKTASLISRESILLLEKPS